MDAREVKVKLAERYVVALTLWAEARAEFSGGRWRTAPIESRAAVGAVIANRVKAPKRFGENFKDVCLKPNAFSCWQHSGGADNFKALMLRAEAFIARGDAAPHLALDKILRECLALADGFIQGSFTDRVGGATHYYADWIAAPAWTAPPAELTAKVGGHLFYRNVR